jgi:hypothetical protein
MLLDHVDGGVLWERHLGHPVSELVSDDEFACACTPDGDGSTVVSMIDGRLVRTCTVPNRRQRIATSGRRIVSVVQPEGSFSGEPSETVRIEAIDPVSLEREVFGEFPGRSRTVMDGAERLLVLAPDGTLTALECGRGRVFVTRLPEMPTRFEHLHVVSVPGRHLVVAGAHEAGDLEQAAAAQIASAGEDLTPPLSGAIWSVDRSTGEPLWPAPATIERHAIPLHQPAELPILLLVRRHPDREIARSEVVCLDARTGHAIFQQDVELGPQHGGGGFELVGNPDDGTIALVEGPVLTLQFTQVGALLLQLLLQHRQIKLHQHLAPLHPIAHPDRQAAHLAGGAGIEQSGVVRQQQHPLAHHLGGHQPKCRPGHHGTAHQDQSCPQLLTGGGQLWAGGVHRGSLQGIDPVVSPSGWSTGRWSRRRGAALTSRHAPAPHLRLAPRAELPRGLPAR